MEETSNIDERLGDTVYYKLSEVLTKLIGKRVQCRGIKIEHGKKNMIDGVLTIEWEEGTEEEKTENEEKKEELITWMEYIQETLANHTDIEKWVIGGNNVLKDEGNLCDNGKGYVEEEIMDKVIEESNEEDEDIYMKRIPGTHWICNEWKDDPVNKEYELEFSIGIIDDDKDEEEWKKKWIEEWKEHELFVRMECQRIGIEVEDESERMNENRYPYILDMENGGQDVFITARVLCEKMREEEEEEAAIKIQRWFRGKRFKKDNTDEKYKIIMDTMEILDGAVVLVILMNKISNAPYIIMLGGEDERGMEEGLQKIFEIEGKPEEVTITMTQSLLDEREYFCEENDIPYKSKQLLDITGVHSTYEIRKTIEEMVKNAEEKEKTTDEQLKEITKQMFNLINGEEAEEGERKVSKEVTINENKEVEMELPELEE